MQLCGFIIEKHDRFLSKYKQDLESFQRILVLREEIDQLEHWVKSGETSYKSKLDVALAELESLKRSKKKVNDKSIDAVKNKINSHERALEYWRNRMKGIANEQ